MNRFLLHRQSYKTVMGSITTENLWKEACFITRLVASSVCISETAGGLIKNVLSSGKLGTINKSDDKKIFDFQTEADRAAQFCIEKSLQKKFMNRLRIIGEEEVTSSVPTLELEVSPNVLSNDKNCKEELRGIREEDVVVWVDPLDGTSEFVEGKDNAELLVQVTVLIGIAYKGHPVAGVIHQPFFENGRTIWGICGAGIGGISTKFPCGTDRVVVTSRNHFTPSIQKALDALASKSLVTKIERAGGAGFKVLRCLEGAAAYVYPSKGSKKWDTAATDAILSAAGGKLTDVFGRDINYDADADYQNKHGIVATAPWVDHKEYIDNLPTEIKDSLS